MSGAATSNPSLDSTPAITSTVGRAIKPEIAVLPTCSTAVTQP